MKGPRAPLEGAAPPVRVGCVLLASGFSRRYGSNKLFSLWRGVPLYRRAFSALPPSLFHRAVVTSQYPAILEAARASGYQALANSGAEEGVAAGIRLGLSALLDLDGVLFSVCDQPELKTDSILRLIYTFQESPDAVCALAWQGRRGNPVLFPRSLFPELLALRGDTGGAAVLRRHPELLRLVEAGEACELADLDRPGELFHPPSV